MHSHKAGPRVLKKFVLVLGSNLSQLGRVEPFLKKVSRELGLDEVQFNKLYLATTEAVTNGIIHGNRHDPMKHVTLTCEIHSNALIVIVRDEGEGHDFKSVPNPLAKKRMLRESGRGIFLMRTLMDNVRHRMNSGGSEVVMKLLVKKRKNHARLRGR